MSEIVRTEQRTQKQNSSRRNGVSVSSDVTEVSTAVRSLHGGDVSMLRDFLAALDAANAPDSARIECRHDGAALVGLTAHWKTYDQPAEQVIA